MGQRIISGQTIVRKGERCLIYDKYDNGGETVENDFQYHNVKRNRLSIDYDLIENDKEAEVCSYASHFFAGNAKMSAVKAHHDLSDIELYTIVKNKVKTNEHSIIDYKVTPIGSTNGYLGAYFHLDMTIKDKHGEPNKHRFFLKTMPIDAWQTEFLSADGVFENEVNFYKNISGCFRKYLSSDVYPECFLAEPEKLVLTDATIQGYRPLKDLIEPLDYEHTKLGLEALARLHAGSIIYEEKTGRKVGTDFPDSASEVTFKAGSRGLDYLWAGAEAIDALVPHLDISRGRDPEAVTQLRDQIVPWMIKLQFYLEEDTPHRRVICHGDSWPANFLYKYDDQGKPKSAMIVDFQMTRSRSPAVDVNTFMYLSVPTDDLKKWRENLLDAYYKAMAGEMRNCGLDADRVYPKEEFLQAYTYYQIVGIIYGFQFFSFSRVRPDVMAKATDTKEKGMAFFYKDRKQHLIDCYKDCPLLRRFLNGVIDELYENFVKTTRGHTEFTR